MARRTRAGGYSPRRYPNRPPAEQGARRGSDAAQWLRENTDLLRELKDAADNQPAPRPFDFVINDASTAHVDAWLAEMQATLGGAVERVGSDPNGHAIMRAHGQIAAALREHYTLSEHVQGFADDVQLLPLDARHARLAHRS